MKLLDEGKLKTIATHVAATFAVADEARRRGEIASFTLAVDVNGRVTAKVRR